MDKEYTIGVLGGMGTYATIHLFQQYAEIFEAEKEWDRPRMIIDNRCTMPSRVRAFLYNENVDKLVDQMADSMQRLKDAGCTRIVLACNTSHLFLPMIYEKVPGLEPLVIHIIKGCVDALSKDGVKEVYLLGTEGRGNDRFRRLSEGSGKRRHQVQRPCPGRVHQAQGLHRGGQAGQVHGRSERNLPGPGEQGGRLYFGMHGAPDHL